MEHTPGKDTNNQEVKIVTFSEQQKRFIKLHFKELKSACSTEDMVFLVLVCKLEKSFFIESAGKYATEINHNKLINIESGIANLRKIIRKNPGIQPAVVGELLDKISSQIFISTDKSGVYLDNETSESRQPLYESMLNKCIAVINLSEEIISALVPENTDLESIIPANTEQSPKNDMLGIIWEYISNLEELKTKYSSIHNRYRLNLLLHDSSFAETVLVNDICGDRTEMADWSDITDSFWKKVDEYKNTNPNKDCHYIESIKPLTKELLAAVKVFNI
jgi:hypothetical protein